MTVLFLHAGDMIAASQDTVTPWNEFHTMCKGRWHLLLCMHGLFKAGGVSSGCLFVWQAASL